MNKIVTSFFNGWLKEKKRRIFLFLGGFLFFLAGYFFNPNFSQGAGNKVPIKEILVKYQGSEEVEVVPVKVDEDIGALLAAYNQQPEVEYAEPNYKYQAAIIPSDIYFPNQWYLNKIKAVEAWNIAREAPEIVIAVIDTGVDIDHPDLKDNIWRNKDEIPDNNIDDDNNGYIDDVYGWDFINNQADPQPKFLGDFTYEGIIHGTVVAGVAASYGNNGIGVSGVVWQAKIMSLKALNDRGEGSTLSVAQAIDYAVDNGANIINLSFVGSGFSHTLDNAIRRAYEAGVIVVAAAGNEEDGGGGYNMDKTPMYPVCNDGLDSENMVLGVTATDALDEKANFAGFGFRCIDIAAPGVSIFNTTVYAPEHKSDDPSFALYYNGYWSGTSMAAPMVSGALALIEAVNPALNRDEVINVLLTNSNNINRLNPSYLGRLGRGRLNVKAAVREAKKLLDEKKFYLVIAPKKERKSEVKITDRQGRVINKFFAYNEHFRGGVNVAAGDLDGDGVDEIITGAGPGGGPHVRIFKLDGKVIGQFFAYNEHFRGGVQVAAIKLNHSARPKKMGIVTAAGPGGGPHVRIFNDQGEFQGQFFAYQKRFHGGVDVAVADVDQDGYDEIVTAAGPGGGPHVRIFRTDGQLVNSFYGFSSDFIGGVNVGAMRYRN